MRARTAELVAAAPPDAVVVNDVPLLVEAGYRDRFRAKPGITGLAQFCGDADDVGRHGQRARRLGEFLERFPMAMDVRGQSEPGLVLAGHDAGACGGANRPGGVELRKPHALRGKTINGGCFIEFVSIATEISPA